jgi:hypothetical protein
MRTTVSIPDPLLENAKQLAAQRGTTLSDVVGDALRMLLSSAHSGPAKPFRLITVQGGPTDPTLDLDRTSALIALDDEESYSRSRG